MKTLFSTIIVTAALGGAASAEAGNPTQVRAVNVEHAASVYQVKHHRYDDDRRHRYRDRHYDDQRYRNKRGKHRSKHYGKRKIRLDIPVDWYGDGRLKLKRLARYHHGIDLDNYRLVRVVLDSHNRRHGAARLRVGQHLSDLVYLGYGRSVIHAPRTRGNGRWVLKLDDAAVSNVRLVLEPRRGHRQHDKHNHRYSDAGRPRDHRYAHRAYRGHHG